MDNGIQVLTFIMQLSKNSLGCLIIETLQKSIDSVAIATYELSIVHLSIHPPGLKTQLYLYVSIIQSLCLMTDS